MKAVEFTDKNIKYVELPRGTYEVDGLIVECEQYLNKVSVVDFNSVKPITRNTVVCHYTTNGDDIVSVQEYENKKNELLKKQTTINDEEECIVKWESLEDEFAYKKFISIHTPIRKIIEVTGDTLKFDVQTSVIDTGCPFINSDFANGGSSVSLFVYNRPSAMLQIVIDCFTSLGMQFKENIGYKQTENNKVWSNSTHSGIRYVTAFGTYVFNDSYNNITIQRGVLDQMIDKYNSDKKTIETIIKTKYNLHFGRVDQGLFDFNKLLNTLKSAESRTRSINYKQVSRDDYMRSLSLLNEAIKQIEQSYKE